MTVAAYKRNEDRTRSRKALFVRIESSCSGFHQGLFPHQELLPPVPFSQPELPGPRRAVHGHLQPRQRQQECRHHAGGHAGAQ